MTEKAQASVPCADCAVKFEVEVREEGVPVRRWLCAAFCVLLCLPLAVGLFPLSTGAVSQPDASDVRAAYLACLDNGQVLFEQNTDITLYPASTVKIMTGYLACRLLGDRLGEPVTLTDAMLAGVSGRSLRLAEGETLTVRDLLYAALCGGYNDATVALAVLASGSVSEFVSLMNREAGLLGADGTHFTNPTGLHEDGMVTTAHDVAAIARAAWGNDLFMQTVSATSYTIAATNVSKTERTVYNRNLLLSDSSQNYRNGYCRGMSAGMTDEGGWCVVTVYERDGSSLLCLVMGGADVPNGEIIPAYTRVNALLTWARQNFGYRQLYAPGGKYTVMPVGMTGLSSSRAQLVLPDGLSVYLPKDADEATELSEALILMGGSLEAPLTAGDVVGTLTVSFRGEVIASAPVAVTENFAVSGFLARMQSFKHYLGSRAFFASLACFTLLLSLYIGLVRKRRGRYGTRRERLYRRILRTRRVRRATNTRFRK